MSLPVSQWMVMPAAVASRRSRLIALRWARVQRGEKVVESRKALVVPVELLVGTLQEAVACQKSQIGFAGERHMRR